MKLYKVILKGVSKYSLSYAVADTSDEAYKLVRKFLDEKDLCFQRERQLTSVELIADEQHYGESETMLYIKKESK